MKCTYNNFLLFICIPRLILIKRVLYVHISFMKIANVNSFLEMGGVYLKNINCSFIVHFIRIDQPINIVCVVELDLLNKLFIETIKYTKTYNRL